MTNRILSNIIPSTDEEAKLVHNKIVAFNNVQVPYTQDPSFISKNYVIKENGEIIAGINAFIYNWCILYIDILFVDERHRGKELGGSLLSRVENEAKTMGTKLVHLSTFDFQAKDFYLKHGYEIFGVLDDCPEGHKSFYLKKIL